MNNIRVVYATRTKHSQKLAEAIGKELNVKAENVTDRPVLKGVGLLFIVGGIYGGKSMPELLEFAKNLDGSEIKSVALVTSCLSKKHPQAAIRKLLQEKGVAVADEILCQGSFLFMGLGHPNKADIAEVASFAGRLAGKA